MEDFEQQLRHALARKEQPARSRPRCSRQWPTQHPGAESSGAGPRRRLRGVDRRRILGAARARRTRTCAGEAAKSAPAAGAQGHGHASYRRFKDRTSIDGGRMMIKIVFITWIALCAARRARTEAAGQPGSSGGQGQRSGGRHHGREPASARPAGFSRTRMRMTPRSRSWSAA